MAAHWSAEDLVRIVSYGGGIDTSAKRLSVEDAVRIASYAANKGSTVIFRETTHWSAQDAIRIASYGKGHVILGD